MVMLWCQEKEKVEYDDNINKTREWIILNSLELKDEHSLLSM